jgi:hypothetical protein
MAEDFPQPSVELPDGSPGTVPLPCDWRLVGAFHKGGREALLAGD